MRTLTTLKKPSRKDAHTLAGFVHDGQTLTDEERDLLLNYFAPSPPKIAKNEFDWVAKACGVRGKEPREVLCVVHVKSGKAVATDGHRIHWGLSHLPDGQYDPRTCLKLADEMPNRYDFDRIKGRLFEGREVSLEELPLVQAGPEGKVRVAKTGDDTGFQVAYLQAGVNAGRLSGTAFIEGRLLTGKSPFGTFSVMALRLPK